MSKCWFTKFTAPMPIVCRGLQRTPLRAFKTAAILLVVCLVIEQVQAADPLLPSLDRIEKVVVNHFSTLTDYQPGDLISRDQVKPIFKALAAIGWKVSDADEILNLVPDKDEFMVRELRTPAGRKFMRQSGKYPLALDRIDRMSRMIMGEQNVRALVRGPDGYKMIQYMTSTPWGHNMGQMLSQDPRAADFNAPTGRIYTADALMAQLAQSYASELAARQENAVAR